MSEYIEVHTTIDTKEGALQIAEIIVSKRLAACVQVSGPIFSTYWWEGKMEQTEEWVCTMKTRRDLYPELEMAIKAIHPYEVPEILGEAIVEGNPDYLNWIEVETSMETLSVEQSTGIINIQ